MKNQKFGNMETPRRLERQKDEEEHEKQPEYSEFEGLDEDWEEFNRREFGNV